VRQAYAAAVAERPRISLLYEFFVTTQRVRVLLGRAMADAPLRPDEYAVYSLLFDEGPTPPTQMARALGMPLTTLHEYTRAMLSRGHAERAPNPGDRRSYLLSLTRAGIRTHRLAANAFDEANDRLLAGLRIDQTEHARTLHDLQQAAEQASATLAAVSVERAG
jgi:DNA-binding MarR family transcriptional regulator